MTKTLLCIVLLLSLLVSAQNYPELFPYRDRNGNGIGYFLKDGTNVIKGQFSSATNLIDGYYIVSKAEHELTEGGRYTGNNIPDTEKFALLDETGKFIITFESNYNYITVENGIIEVGKNNLYGIVNNENKILLPIEYEQLDIKNQETIIAKKNQKVGIINGNFKIIIPFEYAEIYDYTQITTVDKFYVIVKKGNTTGVLDGNNNFIIPLSNKYIEFITEKSVAIKNNNKFTLFDFDLKPLLNMEFEKMYPINIDKSEIYAENKGIGYHYTVDGKLLKKETLQISGE